MTQFVIENPASEKRRALFMHTQKTAGSSIIEMSRKFYGRENVIGFDQHARLSQQACASAPFLSGHFGFEFAKPFMNDRYCFTFLRDPIERVLSLYAYALSRPEGEIKLYDAAKQVGLDGFLQQEQFRTHVWNNQVWQLSCGWSNTPAGTPRKQVNHFEPEHLYELALSHLARFDYVGFVDTIDADAVAIFQSLGWKSPEVLRVNVTPQDFIPADLTDTQRALLHEATELDRRLYDVAKRVYARKQVVAETT